MTNAETITQLADTALDLHTRARASIEPGGDTIGDGMPHAGGFGPKAPLSHPMLDLADSLTRTLHGLCEALWGAGVCHASTYLDYGHVETWGASVGKYSVTCRTGGE